MKTIERDVPPVSWLDGIEERVVAAYREKGLKAVAFELFTLGVPLNEIYEFENGFDCGIIDGIDGTHFEQHERTPAELAGFRLAQAVIAAGLRD